MRSICFWFGAGSALLASLVHPVWGYTALSLMALHQVLVLSIADRRLFLLVHYVVVLIYFSIAPAMQISEGTEFWQAGTLQVASHRQSFFILMAYLCGVELVAGQGSQPTRARSLSSALLPPLGPAALAVVTTAATAAFCMLLTRPALNFVARGVITVDENRPLDVFLLSTFPKTFVLLAFVVLLLNAVRARTLSAGLAAFALLPLALLAGNPVNTPRQILVIGLLPLAITLLGRRHRLWFSTLLFGAVAGMGPILNFISRGSFYGLDIDTFPNSQDFDPMFVVAGLLERSHIPELGYGRYLLSALSFVLPRELKLFPDFDPLGWGTVGGNFSQTNLSLPPFFTLFLDFWYLGPVALGAMVAAIFRRVERGMDDGLAPTTAQLLGLVLLAAYVPLSRGPILGAGPLAAASVIGALMLGALSTYAVRLPAPLAFSRDR